MKKFLSTALIGTALVAGSMSVQAQQSMAMQGSVAAASALGMYNQGSAVVGSGDFLKAVSMDKKGNVIVDMNKLGDINLRDANGSNLGTIKAGQIRAKHKKLYSVAGAKGVSITPDPEDVPKLAFYYKKNQPNKVAKLALIQKGMSPPNFSGMIKKEMVVTKITSDKKDGSKLKLMVKEAS